MTKFKVGKKVMVYKTSGMAARKGATAIVRGIKKGLGWLDVEWIRNDLDGGQMDGEYSIEHFKVIDTNVWKGKRR